MNNVAGITGGEPFAVTSLLYANLRNSLKSVPCDILKENRGIIKLTHSRKLILTFSFVS